MAKSLLEAYFSPWGTEDLDNVHWARKGDGTKEVTDGNARPGAVSPALGVQGWKSKAPDSVKKAGISSEQNMVTGSHGICTD